MITLTINYQLKKMVKGSNIQHQGKQIPKVKKTSADSSAENSSEFPYQQNEEETEWSFPKLYKSLFH